MPAVLKIDLNSEVPAYRQIADGLRLALVRGEVTPGATLPSSRQLAVDFGVHFNTVAEAYRILADEGWLDLRRRRGAVVLDRAAPVTTDDTDRQRLSQGLRELIAKMRAAGLAPSEIAIEIQHAIEETS